MPALACRSSSSIPLPSITITGVRSSHELPGVRAIVPDLRGHGASELGSTLPVGAFTAVPDAPVLTMAQLAADVLALLDSPRTCLKPSLPAAPSAATSCWNSGVRRRSGCAASPSSVPSLSPMPKPISLKRVATIAQARADGVAALFDGMAQSLIGASARAQHPADRLRTPRPHEAHV